MVNGKPTLERGGRAILDPVDALLLQHEGTLIPIPGPCGSSSSSSSYMLHKRRLHAYADTVHQGLALPPRPVARGSSGLTRPAYLERLDDWVEVPARLESVQTLLFLGFDAAAALEIHELWRTWNARIPGALAEPHLTRDRDGGRLSFLALAEKYVRGNAGDQHDDGTDHDDAEWFRVLQACHVAPRLQAEIMAPQLAWCLVRRQRPCSFWLLRAIRLRYRSLLLLRAASACRAARAFQP